MEAIKLMLVGMTTVFAVLGLVMITGNTLISIINKFFPEKEKPAVVTTQARAVINPNAEFAISEAIKQLTGGKGQVQKIEKI